MESNFEIILEKENISVLNTKVRPTVRESGPGVALRTQSFRRTSCQSYYPRQPNFAPSLTSAAFR
jgi:hypothetical protein